MRKLLKEVLDVGETTAKKIISLSNGTESLREVKPLGRPKKVLTEEYIYAMHSFSSAQKLVNRLLRSCFKII